MANAKALIKDKKRRHLDLARQPIIKQTKK
jgi:hypothetical protein